MSFVSKCKDGIRADTVRAFEYWVSKIQDHYAGMRSGER